MYVLFFSFLVGDPYGDHRLQSQVKLSAKNNLLCLIGITSQHRIISHQADDINHIIRKKFLILDIIMKLKLHLTHAHSKKINWFFILIDNL